MSQDKKIDNIEKDVREIKSALLGDEFGNMGYLHRIEETERHIERHKKRIWMERGVIISLSGIWALVVKFWDKIFS